MKTEHSEANTEATERVVDLLSGVPIVATNQTNKPGVIFIIERVCLEIGKIGKVCLYLCKCHFFSFIFVWF